MAVNAGAPLIREVKRRGRAWRANRVLAGYSRRVRLADRYRRRAARQEFRPALGAPQAAPCARSSPPRARPKWPPIGCTPSSLRRRRSLPSFIASGAPADLTGARGARLATPTVRQDLTSPAIGHRSPTTDLPALPQTPDAPAGLAVDLADVDARRLNSHARPPPPRSAPPSSAERVQCSRGQQLAGGAPS